MALDLRPLTLGELLDRAFGLYRAHFLTFVAIMAVPAVLGASFGFLLELVQARTFATGAPPPTRASLALLITPLIAVWIGILFYLAVHIVAVGATTAAVSELYMGREATARGSYDRVRSRIGRLLLVLVLTTLRLGAALAIPLALGSGLVAVAAARSAPAAAAVALMLGLVLMFCGVAVALFLTVRYSLSVPAVVIEEVTAGQAIRRSIALMRGNLGRGSVLILFAAVISQIASLVFQGPFIAAAFFAGPASTAAFWLRLIGACTGAVGQAVSTPLMSVALALLYYDSRIRHEGLDLQIMMDALDRASAAPASPRLQPLL